MLSEPRRAEPLAYRGSAAELKKTSGLLMLFGFAVFNYPLDSISKVIREDQSLVSDLDVCRVFGNIFLILIGLLSVGTGYLQSVHEWGNKYLSRYATILTQAGWVVFLVDMIDVAVDAAEMVGLIPLGYNPTEADYEVVGICTILGLVAYGIALMGSLSFLQSIQFSLHTQSPQETELNMQLRTYSLALFVAGLAQFILGGYLMTTSAYEYGLQEHGPIIAPALIVYNPALNLAVGTGQLCNGIWGILRSFQVGSGGGFYASTLAGFLVQVVAHLNAQGSPNSSGASSLIAASLVLHLMPLFVDSLIFSSQDSVVDKTQTPLV